MKTEDLRKKFDREFGYLLVFNVNKIFKWFHPYLKEDIVCSCPEGLHTKNNCIGFNYVHVEGTIIPESVVTTTHKEGDSIQVVKYGDYVQMNDRFETVHIWNEEIEKINAGRWEPKIISKENYDKEMKHSWNQPVIKEESKSDESYKDAVDLTKDFNSIFMGLSDFIEDKDILEFYFDLIKDYSNYNSFKRGYEAQQNEHETLLDELKSITDEDIEDEAEIYKQIGIDAGEPFKQCQLEKIAFITGAKFVKDKQLSNTKEIK